MDLWWRQRGWLIVVLLPLVALLFALPGPAGAQATAEGKAGAGVAVEAPLGRWLTDGGKSQVEIRSCGETLCGEIVWLKEPNTEAGQPKTDERNPDEAMRDRPILGLRLLSGFVRDGTKDAWRDGKIYNPEDGKTYSATMTLEKPDRLKVRGYVGLPLFGKSQVWSRVR